jgi:hypothetical protein
VTQLCWCAAYIQVACDLSVYRTQEAHVAFPSRHHNGPTRLQQLREVTNHAAHRLNGTHTLTCPIAPAYSPLLVPALIALLLLCLQAVRAVGTSVMGLWQG